MNLRANQTEIIKRYILLVFSLLFSAFGVAITKRGGLGVSPISSIPNVISLKFTFLSMGNWLIIWNCVLILAQVLILKREFRLIELLQIPVSFLFGWFTDLGVLLASFIPADLYAVKLALVLIGTVVLGFGISLSVIANVTMNPGEALVRTIAKKVKISFGTLKMVLDISYVVTAVLLSLLLFDMRIVGAREGTFIAAVFTGITIKFFAKRLEKPLNALIQNENAENT